MSQNYAAIRIDDVEVQEIVSLAVHLFGCDSNVLGVDNLVHQGCVLWDLDVKPLLNLLEIFLVALKMERVGDKRLLFAEFQVPDLLVCRLVYPIPEGSRVVNLDPVNLLF